MVASAMIRQVTKAVTGLRPSVVWRSSAVGATSAVSSSLAVTSSSSPFATSGSSNSSNQKTLPPSNEVLRTSALPHSVGFSSWLPIAFFTGVLGFGSAELCYADASEEGSDPASAVPADSSPKASGTDDLFAHTKQRLEDLIRIDGLQHGSYPPYIVAVKGQKVIVKFKVPPTCEISQVIMDIVTHLGVKSENGSSEMKLRAWSSIAAWQLTLNKLEGMKDATAESHDDGFCVMIFAPLVAAEDIEIEFIKRGRFSFREFNSMVSALKLAGKKENNRKSLGRDSKGYTLKNDLNPGSLHSIEKSISALEAMGVRVYGVDDISGVPAEAAVLWDNLAGYAEQKREIEDTILLALQSPEIYDDIARATRCKFESNRPRAVLFEGPPGTGKTSSARVISKQVGIPLLYVPLEVIMSKYYGESESLLAKIFSLANELPTGAIIFLDEIDSFAVARDTEIHEATRRVLSVLLRQIDGFEQENKVVVIAATNRKQDLDPALISRFDSMISFPLPDQQTRENIAAQYAKHLKKSELSLLASAMEEMSGRDIRDVCQQAERHWASKLIRGQVPKDAFGGMKLPPIEEYVQCAHQRRLAVSDASVGRANSSSRWNKVAVI